MPLGGLSGWWNNYFDERSALAAEFRETGDLNNVVVNRNKLDPGNKVVGCTANSQCASGWACVGGRCQQVLDDSGTTGGVSGPGDCDITDQIDEEVTTCPTKNGGPDGCQEKPTCGDGSPDEGDPENCCSEERCCQYGSLSSPFPGVRCFCGPCPTYAECSQFCDSYLKANGEPGPGCKEFFNGNSCDSCTFCDTNLTCQPLDDAPCYCDGGKECNKSESCLTCNTDPESPGFGDCEEDTVNCKECATIAHTCCAGNALPTFEYCQPKGSSGLSALEGGIEYAKKLCARKYGDTCCEPDCHCHADCAEYEECGGNGVCAPLPCCSGWTLNYTYYAVARGETGSYPFDCQYGGPVEDFTGDPIEVEKDESFSPCSQFLRWEYFGSQRGFCDGSGNAINCGASGSGMTEEEAIAYFGVDMLYPGEIPPKCGMTDSIYFIGRFADDVFPVELRGKIFARFIAQGTVDSGDASYYKFRRFIGGTASTEKFCPTS